MANPEVVAAPPQTPTDNQRRLWPRISKAAALLGIGAAGALYAATNIETETMIAGHRIETRLSTDGFATFDTGMPGSVATPVDFPAGLGAHLNIKEMPADLSLGSDPAELSASDLTFYAQSLSSLEDDLQKTAEAIAKQSLMYGLGAMTLAMALYKFQGKEARRLVYDQRIQPAMERLSPALMAVSMLGLSLPANAPAAEYEDSPGKDFIPVSSAFENTPLEGAYVKGRWMQLAVNTAGVEILGYINRNDEFYKKANENLQLALEKARTYRPTEKSMTALFYTDYHCNTGMSRLLKTAAEKYEISLALDAGDTTASGSEYEEFCTRPLAKALKGIPKAVSLGNHDSPVTGKQLEVAGFKILDTKPSTLAGITIIGDNDPRRSRLGVDMYHTSHETVDDLGDRLADTACEAEEPVDVVLVHDHDAAQETLRRGCAHFALSGHTHKESFQEITGIDGIPRLLVTGASTGGAGGDMPTFGPLYDDAWFAILKIDRETHQLTGYQTVTVHPDTSVTLGHRVHRFIPRLRQAE